MAFDVYQTFLRKEEIEHLTGRVKPKCIIRVLNERGIKFTLDGDDYPVVRRDYDSNKPLPYNPPTKEEWMPNVLIK